MKKEREEKILIFGAGGLVGSKVAEKLLKNKDIRAIGLVSLKDNAAVERLASFNNSQNTEIHYYWKNILGPKNLSDIPLESVLNDDSTKFELLKFLAMLNGDSARDSSVFALIKDFKPTVIVDCVNTATILSYYSTDSAIEPESQLAEMDLGLELLIQYFRNLSKIFEIQQTDPSFAVGKYIKVGTTGVGGMGLDIPFTHGEEKPSKELMHKIAFAGAQTMLLYALSNNRYAPVIKEIKPATAVFNEKLRYTESLGKHGKVYTTAIDLDAAAAVKNLSDFFQLDRHLKQNGYYLDGGESGPYSVQEFLLLTNNDLMGMVTADEIAEKIIGEINADTGNDIISAINSSAVHSSKKKSKIQNSIIKESKKNSKSFPLVFGYLGPRRISKLLIEADIVISLNAQKMSINQNEKKSLTKFIQTQISRKGYKNMLSSLGIPTVLPSNQLIIYDAISVPKESFNGIGLSASKKLYEVYLRDQWVDLRIPNLLIWQKRLEKSIHRTATPQPFQLVKEVITSNIEDHV